MTTGGGSDRRTSWLAALAALVSLTCVLYVGAASSSLGTSVDSVVARMEGALMQVKVTSWYSKSANGTCILQTVSTPKGTMNREEWQAAHDEAVTDMQASYPPASDCPVPQ